MLFDLPAVAARAARALRGRRPVGARRAPSAAISAPTRCRRGADLVTLVRVLHDHDDATVRALLRAVRAACRRAARC